MKYLILAFVAIVSFTTSLAYAAKLLPAYKDYSGVYICTGMMPRKANIPVQSQ
jgi:hypothetical protein